MEHHERLLRHRLNMLAWQLRHANELSKRRLHVGHGRFMRRLTAIMQYHQLFDPFGLHHSRMHVGEHV